MKSLTKDRSSNFKRVGQIRPRRLSALAQLPGNSWKLLDDGGSGDSPRVQAFLAGYRSKREVDEQHLALLPEYSALTKLQGWASLNRAIDLTPDEVDQEWMISLIGRISDYQQEYESELQVIR